MTYLNEIEQITTQLNKLERRLEESKDKYENILESIDEGYYEVDLEGNLTFFNRALCEMYGYSRHELFGMNYKEYTDEKTAEKIYKEFSKVYETEEKNEITDWQVIRKDGIKIWVETSVDVLKNSNDNRIIGFRGMQRNVTSKKETVEQLRISQNRYKRLVELTTEGIAICSQDLIIEDVNPSFCNIAECENINDMVGVHLNDIGVTEEGCKSIISAIDKGERRSFDVEFCNKDNICKLLEIRTRGCTIDKQKFIAIILIKDVSCAKNYSKRTDRRKKRK